MGLPCGTFNETYRQDKAIIRTRMQWFFLIAGMALIFGVIPNVSGPFLLTTFILCGYYIIGTLGINILTGFTGQLSLGHSAFVAVGAYTGATLSYHLGWSFWAAVPCAALMAGSVGLIFGLPSLRVKGFYLALATLAAQVIIMYAITHFNSLTRGVIGIPVPSVEIGGFAFNTDYRFYYLCMAFVVILTIIAHNIARSKLGRAFMAIRDNDLAAEVMGINLLRYKLLAFFIGCAYAGIAGVIYAYWMGAITPEPFTLMESVWYLGMVIVGGLASTFGSVAGAVVITFLSEYTTYFFSSLANVWPEAVSVVLPMRGALFAGIVILFLIFEPRGLAHRWALIKSYYRLWPFTY